MSPNTLQTTGPVNVSFQDQSGNTIQVPAQQVQINYGNFGTAFGQIGAASSTATISVQALGRVWAHRQVVPTTAAWEAGSSRPPRGFNRYVNASDLLEEFIAFLGDQAVRQGEALSLPLELFVKWLVLQACEADGDEPPAGVQLALPSPVRQPRCLGCQRFMPRAAALPLHDGRCAERYFARAA